MGGSSESGERLRDSGVIEVTGKIMVVTLVLLFFVVVFVFCLHLYARWFWYRRQENATTTTTTRGRRLRRRRRFDFAAGHEQITVSSSSRPGLDPWVLKTIPVMVFDPKEFEDGLECAVCLCEISGGEKARLLPKCNHGFHVDCIDMWFQTHSTCPLCRNPVANQIEPNPAAESALDTTLQAPTGENSGVNPLPAEAPNFPANVLIWGNEAQVSTFGRVEESNQGNAVAGPSSSSSASSSSRPDGISVIDVPSQINEEEEPKSPAPARLRSLKRLLSGNNRRVNPSSPRNLDLEQGGRGPI